MRVPLDRSNCFLKSPLILCGFFATFLTNPVYPQQRTSEASLSVAELIASAESGDRLAQKQLSDLLVQGNPADSGYDLALAWVRSAASRNEPDSQFLLGYLYEHGLGVPRDYRQAAENYELAAQQGNPSAQNNLADLYHRGLGVHKDAAKAFGLFLAAAQQGNRIAQWNLAYAYFEANGTRRDLSQAVRWFRAASLSTICSNAHSVILPSWTCPSASHWLSARSIFSFKLV
jgi:TPR repeat protein